MGRKQKYDYKKIQVFFDDDHTWQETSDHFGISQATLTAARNKGWLTTRNRSEAAKLARKLKPQKHTEATKQRISEKRKEFLIANPDKVPYLLNHSSRNSYPEEYFAEVFRNENLKVERYFRVGLYELDFAIPALKIDIEIDGEQHYLDARIVEHDKKRATNLKKLGWETKRIRWSEYQKLNFDEKKKFVQEFMRFNLQ